MPDAMVTETALDIALQGMRLIGTELVLVFVNNTPAVSMIHSLSVTRLSKTTRIQHHCLQKAITDALVGCAIFPTRGSEQI